MARLAVVGSANMDLVFRAERLPKSGETVLGKGFNTFPGGKGANQAVAAGRMGGNAHFVGRVGADPFGDRLRESLVEARVDCRWLLASDAEPTGVAGIVVDANGQNSIVVASGANSTLESDDVKSALEAIRPAVVLTQLEIPDSAVAATVGPWILILNPAPARELPAGLAERVEAITPNEIEAFELTGIEPVDDASCLKVAGSLFDQGIRRVIITLGEKGCFYATPEGGRAIPSLDVRSVDSTAAGDCFSGVLAHFVAAGRDWTEAIVLASAAAALSTTKTGAQASMPTRRELDQIVGI